jgi:hypothetical protein
MRLRYLPALVFFWPGALMAQNWAWDDRFTAPGIVASQPTFTVDSDSNLYATGIQFVNGLPLSPAALYDGSKWQRLGDYLPKAYFSKVFSWRGDKYAYGNVNDGTGYHPSFMRLENGEWKRMFVSNDRLTASPTSGEIYLHGIFDTLNGVPIRHLARWDGESITAIDHGLTFGAAPYGYKEIAAVKEHEGKIYVIGNFSRNDSLRFRFIYSFDNSTGEIMTLDSGTNGLISDIAWWRGQLYAVGEFTEAGGIGAYGIARWDGTRWSSVGTPRDILSAGSKSLLVYEDELLVCGYVVSAGRTRPHSIAAWNGVEWSAKYDPPMRSASSVVEYRGKLFALIDSSGHYPALCTFESAWMPHDFPMHGGMLGLLPNRANDIYISSMAATSENLLVAGDFKYITAGGDTIRNFARFDGVAWFAMPDTIHSGAILYTTNDRLFYTIDSRLFEFASDHPTIVRSFASDIGDVTFAEGKIIVGLNPRYEEETNYPTLHIAPLSTLVFSYLGVYWPIARVRYANKRYYYLSESKQFYYKGDRQTQTWRLTENESFTDLLIDSFAIYASGNFEEPSAFLGKQIVGESMDFFSNGLGSSQYGRQLLKIGEKIFVTGDLGKAGDDYIHLGYVEGNKYTNISESPNSYNPVMASLHGDLYIAGSKYVGGAQSMGIARLILGERSDVKTTESEASQQRTKCLVYPNPASAMIHTGVPCTAIYDRMGRLAQQLDIPRSDIEVDDLIPGIYYLRTTEGSTIPFSIVR